MVVISDPPEVIWIEHGVHRAFDQLVNVLAVFALTQEAFIRRKGGTPPAMPILQLNCYRSGLAMRVSLEGIIEAAESGQAPKSIGFAFLQKGVLPNGFKVSGLRGVIAGTAASAFSLYAERACDWIKKNISTNYHDWPPVANFSRVVRNAIVHGGTVNIQSPAAASVEWSGLQISYLDCGKEIISPECLGPSDLIVLMLDLEAELNQLGAPYDLG